MIKKTWFLFCLFIVLLILINLGINSFVLTKGVYLSFYSERYTAEKLKQIVELIENENLLVSYSIIVFGYSVKIFLISVCVFIGVFLQEYKSTLWAMFRAVILAEFVFLIPSLIVLVWFGLMQTDYSLEDVQGFSPFSVLSLFSTDGLDGWVVFLLKTMNIFHALYVYILARQLSKQINASFWQGLSIVGVTYGLALLFWLSFVVFLFINFS